MENNRKEDSFKSLLEDDKKSIVIPIIQRDYAQGRSDEKAEKVRLRLIDDWITVLADKNKRMDFNFIYGEEAEYGDEKVFFPVDGQQRLTSLYLLHWYLAYRTQKEGLISNWKFDYKTRNSASEFFAFLREGKAKELFEILKSEEEVDDKLKEISDKNWYKMKWENDPTIKSSLVFLCTLSNKLEEYEKENQGSVDKFWNRLAGSNSAIYFTYLPEESKNAEVRAARTYTRMNARGKSLTDFENLKAMMDELEVSKGINNSVSCRYDRIYIDYFYKTEKSEDLSYTTKNINVKSLCWFRNIYHVYKLVIKKEDNYEAIKQNYEEDIYNFSQTRKTDSDIDVYLKMLKAVFEIVCNSKEAIQEVNKVLPVNEVKKDTIAFVLFAYKKWEEKSSKFEQISKNEDVASNWEDFHKLLEDLNYEKWNCTNIDFSVIINAICGDYENSKQYFIVHDFDSENPFKKWGILSDLKNRVLENKMMWKMVEDKIVTEEEIRHFKEENNGRLGSLLYLSGNLNGKNWSLGDYSSWQTNNPKKIKEYMKLISNLKEYNNYPLLDNDARAVYAYASQLDTNKNLKSEKEINSCDNEHIWRQEYLLWDDSEYQNISKDKVTQLDHLKDMLDLLNTFNAHSENERIKEYRNQCLKNLSNGYEECWLRLALQYPDAGKFLLATEIHLEGNVVVDTRGYDVVLRTYFENNGYKNEIYCWLKDDKKVFYKGNEDNFRYNMVSRIYEFDKHENDIVHSIDKSLYKNASGIKENMDLCYTAYVNYPFVKVNGDVYLSVEKENDNIIIRKYDRNGKNNGGMQIKIETVNLDCSFQKNVDTMLNAWKQTIEAIVNFPVNNKNANDRYDMGLELRKGDIKNITIPNGSQAKHNFKKGRRRQHNWSEDFSVNGSVNGNIAFTNCNV